MGEWFRKALAIGLTRKRIFIYVVLGTSASLTEVFGVGLFFPIAQLVQVNGSVETLANTSTVWNKAILFSNNIGMPISIWLLLSVAIGLFLTRQAFIYMRTVYIASIRASLLMNLRNNTLKSYSRTSLEYQDSVLSGSLQAMLTSELNHAVRWALFPLEIANLVILNTVYLFLLVVLSWEMASCIVLV